MNNVTPVNRLFQDNSSIIVPLWACGEILCIGQKRGRDEFGKIFGYWILSMTGALNASFGPNMDSGGL